MWERWLPYPIRIRRLQARKRRAVAQYDAEIARARWDSVAAAFGKTTPEQQTTPKPARDSEQLEDEKRWALLDFDGEIWALQTQHLLDQAQLLFISTPPSGDWISDDQFGYRYLNLEAIARLRSAIRAEKKERWESYARWAPILVALTGALGALAGAIAVFKR